MNQETCPYTFNDIIECKKLSIEGIQQDYKNLVDFKADVNPRKFCGNPILYHYQLENILNCRRGAKGYKTLKECFDNPDELQKLWDETIKRNRRDKDPLCSACDLYECHRLNRGSIVFFKASTAKYIYKLFNATSVVDPTAGWGGRLLGAASLNIKYTGIDTNINLKNGYDNMINDLNIKNCNMIYENCLNIDYSKLEYDLVLTSPPYINLELYENMKPFTNNGLFYIDFLIPMMNKVFEHLKIGGHMCINISPSMFKALIKYGYPKPDSQIDLRQQLGKQFKTKSQDYIYVWKKN